MGVRCSLSLVCCLSGCCRACAGSHGQRGGIAQDDRTCCCRPFAQVYLNYGDGPSHCALPPCRLQLQDKLQLASTEKKGRSKLQNINGVEVMLPTGECSCHQ